MKETKGMRFDRDLNSVMSVDRMYWLLPRDTAQEICIKSCVDVLEDRPRFMVGLVRTADAFEPFMASR